MFVKKITEFLNVECESTCSNNNDVKHNFMGVDLTPRLKLCVTNIRIHLCTALLQINI